MNIIYLAEVATPIEIGFGTAHQKIAIKLKKFSKNTEIISSGYNHYMRKRPVAKKSIHDGVKYYWMPSLYYKNASSPLRVLNWALFTFSCFFKLRPKKYDLIIVSSHSMMPSLVAIMHKVLFRTKYIIDIRDVWPMTFVEIGKKSKYNPVILILSFIEKIAIRYSDSVISTLPNYKKRITELYKKDTKLFRCIPQAYDFEEESAPFDIEKLNISNKKLNIIYAGAMGTTNALETVLELASKINTDDFHFYFLGEGEFLEKFKQKYGKHSNITFLGKVEKKYVKSIVSKMDIGYDSTKRSKLYTYGLSRQKWMDYMNAELPIVCSFSGFKSIINEYNCGFYAEAESEEMLFEVLNKCKILKNQNELSILGKNGQIALNDYRSFDSIAENLNEFINLTFLS